MFEFFVFQAGGLVLWPADCDSARTSAIVNEFIQGQLLEGRSSHGAFVRQRVAAYMHHDNENDLFFCATVDSQIAQQITYMDSLLTRIREAFLDEFDEILSRRNEVMLLPPLFAKFNPAPIVDEFRAKPVRAPAAVPTPPPRAASQDNIAQKKVGSGRRVLGERAMNQEAERQSQVIGSRFSVQKEELTAVDLDDFSTVVKPAEKSASGLRGLFAALLGEKVLTEKDVGDVLAQFEQHLVAKNVAAHIARGLTEEVGRNLIGQKCGTFDSVRKLVLGALKTAIERILTPHRALDVVRDIQNARARGEPYVMAFIGVNGVGKSTSLSKVAYLFKSHGFKVLITACDTFRNGAIDQLQVHAGRLEIELFQRGGHKRDPVPVAKEAKLHAKANGFDVILIDTAGRMQTDTNLMKQIANLIAQVKPDLTVFVAEALVGNNGSDQIRQFDKIITDYGGPGAKGLDGIMLTKFDTVDDKVGAALTLVFETGHPIVFLGVGQHYRDLRRMRPDFVVDTLLAGF
jgi:signal recognition particle receptor subunit alpha